MQARDNKYSTKNKRNNLNNYCHVNDAFKDFLEVFCYYLAFFCRESFKPVFKIGIKHIEHKLQKKKH